MAGGEGGIETRITSSNDCLAWTVHALAVTDVDGAGGGGQALIAAPWLPAWLTPPLAVSP